MTTIRRVLTVLALFSAATPAFAQRPNTLTPQEKAQGWQLLFDGSTLNGWHSSAPVQPTRRAGAPQAPAAAVPGQIGTPRPCVGAKGRASAVVPAGGSHWEVVDGAITACGEPLGYLTSDRSFKNFVLAIDFNCSEDTNSGVFVRSPKETGGYEVQIWRQQPAGFNTGGIVGTARTSREFVFKPGQWNHYEITADGDHLIVMLNGERAVDVNDARFSEGNIRLQYQLYPIAFRNIKIRPLP